MTDQPGGEVVTIHVPADNLTEQELYDRSIGESRLRGRFIYDAMLEDSVSWTIYRTTKEEVLMPKDGPNQSICGQYDPFLANLEVYAALWQRFHQILTSGKSAGWKPYHDFCLEEARFLY